MGWAGGALLGAVLGACSGSATVAPAPVANQGADAGQAATAALPPDGPGVLSAIDDAARRALAAGHAVYRLDPATSRVRVHVGRAGPLAAFGHEHAVAGAPRAGYVDADAGSADLALALAALTVDSPDDRHALGLGEAPGAAAVAGTRRNMLGPVLEAARHPWLRVRVRAAPAGALAVTIDLHGRTRTVPVTAAIVRHADAMSIAGRFSVRQRDFGITPFAALSGALQVADELSVRFDLRAVRAAAQPVDAAAAVGATALPK